MAWVNAVSLRPPTRSDTLQAHTVKEGARKLVEELPDDSTWEDLMYRTYVRQAIEAGLADSENGRTSSVEDVRNRFAEGSQRQWH